MTKLTDEELVKAISAGIKVRLDFFAEVGLEVNNPTVIHQMSKTIVDYLNVGKEKLIEKKLPAACN